MARNLLSSALATGASKLHIRRQMRAGVALRPESLTWWALPYKLFEYFLGAFGESLFTKCLCSTEHRLVILRILCQCLLRRLLRAFPVVALDVARGHICVDLLHEFIRLQYEHHIRSNSPGGDSVNCTSVRSFGSSAPSLRPDLIAEAMPPDLQTGEEWVVR